MTIAFAVMLVLVGAHVSGLEEWAVWLFAVAFLAFGWRSVVERHQREDDEREARRKAPYLNRPDSMS